MSNKNFHCEQDIINALFWSFRNNPPKNKTTYRIKFNGQFVQTNSGKTVWATLVAAKNAFNLHCSAYSFGLSGGKYRDQLSIGGALALLKTGDEYNRDRDEIYKKFVQELMDAKILEFVEIKE